eukprot:TRINITY_DN83543_c0_g1_i1.p1 TRINITY_DN83543_c0_g1~~TRINITY_DN83543_c0_g1_i1.p1  ORF type:complete len:374 (-),score=91.59 TRINITY_DN83543_c0_g1_i1:121-1242(-)
MPSRAAALILLCCYLSPEVTSVQLPPNVQDSPGWPLDPTPAARKHVSAFVELQQQPSVLAPPAPAALPAQQPAAWPQQPAAPQAPAPATAQQLPEGAPPASWPPPFGQTAAQSQEPAVSERQPTATTCCASFIDVHIVELTSLLLNAALAVALAVTALRARRLLAERQRAEQAEANLRIQTASQLDHASLDEHPRDVLCAAQRCAYRSIYAPRISKGRSMASQKVAGVASAFEAEAMRLLMDEKNRAFALMHKLGATRSGALGERLEQWQDGFCAWWESEADFKNFCKLGLPEAKGSILARSICGVLEDPARETALRLQHQDDHESYEFVVVFAEGTQAAKWAEAFVAWKRKVGQWVFMPRGSLGMLADDSDD